jgi:hypothetical protein
VVPVSPERFRISAFFPRQVPAPIVLIIRIKVLVHPPLNSEQDRGASECAENMRPGRPLKCRPGCRTIRKYPPVSARLFFPLSASFRQVAYRLALYSCFQSDLQPFRKLTFRYDSSSLAGFLIPFNFQHPRKPCLNCLLVVWHDILDQLSDFEPERSGASSRIQMILLSSSRSRKETILQAFPK